MCSCYLQLRQPLAHIMVTQKYTNFIWLEINKEHIFNEFCSQIKEPGTFIKVSTRSVKDILMIGYTISSQYEGWTANGFRKEAKFG